MVQNNRTSRLLIHTGGRLVDLKAVRESATPTQEGSHYPIQHGRLLALVTEGLEQVGLHVKSQEHALIKNGQQYFGLMRLSNGDHHDDYELVAALRNAHDKTFAAGLSLGSKVFVCDNLAFSGDVTFARKHTRFAVKDLPGLVSNALGRLGDLRRTQDARIAGYKAAVLTDDQAYATIVRGTTLGVVPNSKVPELVDLWHHPIYEEFAAPSGWGLFNSFTHLLRDYRAEQIPKRTQALHGLMDGACGLQLGTKDVVVVEEDPEEEVEQQRPGALRSFIQRFYSGF